MAAGAVEVIEETKERRKEELDPARIGGNLGANPWDAKNSSS